MTKVRPVTEHVIFLETKRLDTHNRARREAGLPPITPKERNCLCCSVLFLSVSEKRLCRSCNIKNSQE
jgi:hypothetical protein